MALPAHCVTLTRGMGDLPGMKVREITLKVREITPLAARAEIMGPSLSSSSMPAHLAYTLAGLKPENQCMQAQLVIPGKLTRVDHTVQ